MLHVNNLDNGSLLKRGIDAVYALIMSIVTFVLRLTPYGIIAIMASTIATSDFAAIWTLGKFMIASYAALLTMYVIHLIILAIMGINPIRYVKKTLEVLIFAFTSRSSAGALPLNVQTQTQRLEYRRYCKLLSFIRLVYWPKWMCWYLSSNACYYGCSCCSC